MPDVRVHLQNDVGQDLTILQVPAGNNAHVQMGSPPVAVSRVQITNEGAPAPPPPEVEGVITYLRRVKGSCYAETAVFDLAADILESMGDR